MRAISTPLWAAVLAMGAAELPGEAGQSDESQGIIVFESLRAGKYFLYLIKPDGSGLKKLTEGGGPSFSADGKQIVYVAYFNDTGSNDIFIIQADGTNDRRVTKTPDMEKCPVLSTDGKRIAFNVQVTRNNVMAEDVYVMNSDGTGRKKIAEGETPAWSPDGAKLAFAANRKGAGDTSQIYVIDADGSNERRVTKNGFSEREPTWSPDATRLACASYTDRTKRWDIAVVGVDGSGYTRLTNDETGDTHPTWSPDGRKIAFCSNPGKGGKPDIIVMGADGSGPTNITRGASQALQNTYPSWGKGK